MLPELKNVKYASFLNMAAGLLVAVCAAVLHFTQQIDVEFALVIAIIGAFNVVLGFKSAQAANSVNGLYSAKKLVSFGWLLPALGVVDYFLNNAGATVLSLVFLVVSLVAAIVLTAAMLVGLKKIEQR